MRLDMQRLEADARNRACAYWHEVRATGPTADQAGIIFRQGIVLLADQMRLFGCTLTHQHKASYALPVEITKGW